MGEKRGRSHTKEGPANMKKKGRWTRLGGMSYNVQLKKSGKKELRDCGWGWGGEGWAEQKFGKGSKWGIEGTLRNGPEQLYGKEQKRERLSGRG